MASLELLGLTKAWPDITVRVDLVAEAERILVVAGPSGCGKSTVLRMTAGLERPDSGKVIVGGRDVSNAEPSSRGVGMVFQDHALFPHLDVAGNIAYGLRVRRIGRAERARRIAQLLETVGLAGFGRRKPHELSGGERQRVALARTLAVEPGVILFDEPLSSLDASLRKRLRADIAMEQKRLGFTAVYVTHDLEEAMAIADSLAIMDAGRVICTAPPKTLWEDPGSVAVASFLGNGPCIPVTGIKRTTAGYEARTPTGRFPVSPRDAQRAQKGEPVSVFFERTAALPASVNDSGSSGCFSASCLRADFAGDAIDCQMEAGDDHFVLRFPKDIAPLAGETRRYSVRASAIKLVR